ncbi:MAG TPA: hypothetical protein VGQ31_14515, partial [Candidatus Limnocylindrales bacterium]|nr:hypothetical protein [Candidatus Limnocylindrales bacterium]
MAAVAVVTTACTPGQAVAGAASASATTSSRTFAPSVAVPTATATAIPTARSVAAPTATPAGPTAVPPGPLPTAGVLAGGTYVATPFVGIGAADACFTPPQPGCVETAADDAIRITFSVPAGWEVDPLRLGVWLTGKHNAAPDGANLFFERGGWLYTDPCHSKPTSMIRVGPSVDDFANALAQHPSLDTTKPEPVTLGGY